MKNNRAPEVVVNMDPAPDLPVPIDLTGSPCPRGFATNMPDHDCTVIIVDRIGMGRFAANVIDGRLVIRQYLTSDLDLNPENFYFFEVIDPREDRLSSEENYWNTIDRLQSLEREMNAETARANSLQDQVATLSARLVEEQNIVRDLTRTLEKATDIIVDQIVAAKTAMDKAEQCGIKVNGQ